MFFTCTGLLRKMCLHVAAKEFIFSKMLII